MACKNCKHDIMDHDVTDKDMPCLVCDCKEYEEADDMADGPEG